MSTGAAPLHARCVRGGHGLRLCLQAPRARECRPSLRHHQAAALTRACGGRPRTSNAAHTPSMAGLNRDEGARVPRRAGAAVGHHDCLRLRRLGCSRQGSAHRHSAAAGATGMLEVQASLLETRTVGGLLRCVRVEELPQVSSSARGRHAAAAARDLRLRRGRCGQQAPAQKSQHAAQWLSAWLWRRGGRVSPPRSAGPCSHPRRARRCCLSQ
jgi:hypothetical protein